MSESFQTYLKLIVIAEYNQKAFAPNIVVKYLLQVGGFYFSVEQQWMIPWNEPREHTPGVVLGVDIVNGRFICSTAAVKLDSWNDYKITPISTRSLESW